MTNKEMFLKSNVGFHFDDLSLVRQTELKAAISKFNLSNEWVYLALSKDKLEGWEKWGFSLFNKAEFRQEIDNLLKAFDQLKEDDFKKELKRNSKKKNQLSASKEEFMKVYNGIKEQGKVIVKHPEEEEPGEYWTYGNALLPEYYYIADEYAAAAAAGKEIEEEEWEKFFLCFQKVKVIKI